MAGKCGVMSKEEILEQFIEALTEYVLDDVFEAAHLN